MAEPVDYAELEKRLRERLALTQRSHGFYTYTQSAPDPLCTEAADAIAALTRELDEAREWRPTHRHYKGGLYRVLHTALREADLEPVVVYEPEDGPVFVRPMSEFTEKFAGLPGTDFNMHPPRLSRPEGEGEKT